MSVDLEQNKDSNFFNKDLVSNVSSGIQKALEKYKTANSSFWVTSLCFYTILSLVPILAILLSVGSWLSIDKYLINYIEKLSPLKGDAITLITTFSNNLLNSVRNGFLAGIGVLSLAWTLVKMFSLIENCFNDIWGGVRPRTLTRKISDYISFCIVLPISTLVLNTVIIMVVNKLENFLFIRVIVNNLLPFVTLTFFLTVFYIIVPNTKVKFIPAFLSAFCTSAAMFGFQKVFISLQTLIITYNRIYGSFSVVFIFLIWMKILWFLVILGGHLSFFLQNPNLNFLNNKLSELNINSKLLIAISLLKEMILRIQNNAPPLNIEIFCKEARLSSTLVFDILEVLKQNDVLIEGTNEKDERIFSVIKNIDTLIVKDILNIFLIEGENINISNELTDLNIILEDDFLTKTISDLEVS